MKFLPTHFYILAATTVVAATPLHAQTWDGGTPASPNTSGIWSTATNWSTDTVPGAGNTALLDNVTTGTRIVTYDTAAPTTLGTLQFNQTTAGATNELAVQENITVTNNIAVGATAGTSLLYLNQTTGIPTLTIGTGGGTLTVNTGGVVNVENPTAAGSKIAGNVVIAGGTFNEERGLVAGSALNSAVVSGTLSMSAGTLGVGTTPLTGTGASTDNRLAVSGNLSFTGGSVVGGIGPSSLYLSGTTNDFSGLTAFSSVASGSGATAVAAVTTVLTGNAAQSLTLGTVNIGAVLLRGQSGAGGSTIKTITSAGGTIDNVQLLQQSTGATTGLLLGSNLTTRATGTGLSAATFSNGTPVAFTVNTGATTGYTLDVTASTAGLVLNQGGTGITTNWNLLGNGTIRARTFDLSAASTNVSVSGNVTLAATGAAGTTSNLSTAGTAAIAATSTFAYAGTGTAANPAVLNSSRAIGNLTVTSGALRFAGTAGLQGVTTVNTGGLLALAAGSPLTGSTGITLAAGGTLNTTALTTFTLATTQPVTFGINPAGAGSAGLLAAAGLDITNGSVNFTTTAALDDTAYVLATYAAGTLAGTSFAAVTNLPANYMLDYNYLGQNDIALVAAAVPEPSTMCASGLALLILVVHMWRTRLAKA